MVCTDRDRAGATVHRRQDPGLGWARRPAV